LLTKKRARIHKMVPHHPDRGSSKVRSSAGSVKLDPGSKTTGVALVRERATPQDETVLTLIEVSIAADEVNYVT
jgi:hypothetical protein